MTYWTAVKRTRPDLLDRMDHLTVKFGMEETKLTSTSEIVNEIIKVSGVKWEYQHMAASSRTKAGEIRTNTIQDKMDHKSNQEIH